MYRQQIHYSLQQGIKYYVYFCSKYMLIMQLFIKHLSTFKLIFFNVVVLETLLCIQDLCLQLKTNFGGHLPTEETKLLYSLYVVIVLSRQGNPIGNI